MRPREPGEVPTARRLVTRPMPGKYPSDENMEHEDISSHVREQRRIHGPGWPAIKGSPVGATAADAMQSFPADGATLATAADKVVLPSHYARHAIEPIRFAVENYGPGFLIGNAIKYLTRYDAKDGHKDLAKAARYILMLRHYEAGHDDWYAATPWGGLADNADAPLRSLDGKAPSHG